MLIHVGSEKQNKANKYANYVNFTLRVPRFGQLSNVVYNEFKLWNKVQFLNFSVLFETEM